MRIVTRKQDWKIVHISELDRLEKYLTLCFVFGPHLALVLSLAVGCSESIPTILCSRLPCLK